MEASEQQLQRLREQQQQEEQLLLKEIAIGLPQWGDIVMQVRHTVEGGIHL